VSAALARTFDESPAAIAALAALVVMAVLAVAAPVIAPQNPYDLAQLDIMNAGLPPLSRSTEGGLFLLGTDDQGRDVLSAIFYGLRTSVAVAVAATVLAAVVGTAVGLLAAYAGRGLDSFLMGLVDIQLSFPAVLIALMIVALFGTGLEKVVLAIAAVQWAYYARTARAAAMVEREREYVDAARCLAYGTRRILFGHILPNCLGPLIVVATVQVANAIAIEATLSFLGVGLPITEPSLGLLIANGYPFMLSGKYWLSVAPGLVLILLIVAINILGDRLREVFNPRGER
jgi:peptide/nickel transport system permease protein